MEPDYTDLDEILTGTQEGQLLLAAIAKITNDESKINKTPNEVIEQLQELRSKMDFK